MSAVEQQDLELNCTYWKLLDHEAAGSALNSGRAGMGAGRVLGGGHRGGSGGIGHASRSRTSGMPRGLLLLRTARRRHLADAPGLGCVCQKVLKKVKYFPVNILFIV